MIEDHARERRLRHERMILCPAVCKENLHMVRQDPEARVLLRHVVRHNEVEVLFREFLLRIRLDVLCLRRKADENLTALFLPEVTASASPRNKTFSGDIISIFILNKL